MQCVWLKMRLGAGALAPIIFPSAATSILWNPLEFLQGTLAIKNKFWKQSKRFFTYYSNCLRAKGCTSARRDAMQLCWAWMATRLEPLGLGGEGADRPSLGEGRAPPRARSQALVLELLCSSSDCFHIALFPLHVTGWGHLCVFKIGGINKLLMDLEARFLTSVCF